MKGAHSLRSGTKTMVAAIFALITVTLLAFTLFTVVGRSALRMLPAGGAPNSESNTTFQPQRGKVVLEKNHPTWKYRVFHYDTDPNFYLDIQYDPTSISSLVAFANENKVLATQLSRGKNTLDAYVTFRNPVDVDTFRTWAKGKGLHVGTLQLRETVGRVTIGIKATEQDPLPQSELDNLTHGPIAGVINAQIQAPASVLTNLISDPLVFVVDVTPNVARNEVVQSKIARSEQVMLFNWVSPFYSMETLGLENFRDGTKTPLPTIPAPVGTIVPQVVP